MSDIHYHFKPKIAVSGAAETDHCGEGTLEMAEELGREIVRQGAIVVSGATTGFPFWSAKGAKAEGGLSIGLSPAKNEREHVEKYKLPLDYSDMIVFTGSGFSSRDILLTRSADAIVIGCGRIGTIHELTVAFEDGKPIGVLEGPWLTDEIIKQIISASGRAEENPKVVYSKDPKKLVEKVLEFVKKEKNQYYRVHDVSEEFVNKCDDPDCKRPAIPTPKC